MENESEMKNYTKNRKRIAPDESAMRKNSLNRILAVNLNPHFTIE
jgi:hypothetical protein